MSYSTSNSDKIQAAALGIQKGFRRVLVCAASLTGECLKAEDENGYSY
ncbi:hypothetical protein [Nostoc sphaeroides]|uniref:Uncharacterized protein n=1 Tax=Nostoc sphaeroides CCNUC1 TaxID=2653204 RepID=A0A5P8VZ32_9NOSO|nr:hypothetical protein [Nostoc sphaeroides]MCC5629870.1 hypothetical protein [Nostoc sphaeroides CHAB 2801]QFS45581.1 hypothetical protein GXM_03058 [Nostoc sphaeroides CCNUC1]